MTHNRFSSFILSKCIYSVNSHSEGMERCYFRVDEITEILKIGLAV